MVKFAQQVLHLTVTRRVATVFIVTTRWCLVKMEGDEGGGDDVPRRSLRLALTELNESQELESTPNKNSSPDEMVIIQRGPRRKPITWSPVDYNRTKILGPPRERTPEPVLPIRSELNPKLRRRLIMSPNKSPSEDLGLVIAKKLRALNSLEKCTTRT